MITSAALCPWPPLLVRELTGADPVLPELRAACAEAVTELLRDGPEVVAVVGPGTATTSWPGTGRLNIAAFGPGATAPGLRSGRCCHLPLGLRSGRCCHLPLESGPTCWTRRVITGNG